VLIVTQAVLALLEGRAPRNLDLGMGIVGAAGVANCVLGWHLLRVGRREGSAALVADGHHVLADFWTTGGAIVGLFLVKLTGATWIDPVAAILVAGHLLLTGWSLLREAARGLMDELDPAVVSEAARALEAARRPGVIEIHDLRAINVGGRRHVDLHVVVPEFWPVEHAHRALDDFERRTIDAHATPVELQFHMDPCERAYCRRCDYPECPVRRHACEGPRPFAPETVVRGPEPTEPTAVHEDPHPRPAAQSAGPAD
jgi:cation diffusion facilitator family transporter